MRKVYLIGILVAMIALVGCLGGGSRTQFTLTVQVQGDGTVTPSVGTHRYDKETMVSLTATPDEGRGFSHWEGPVADRESAQTQVAMDEDKTVTAVFTQEERYEVTITQAGEGNVTPEVGTHTYSPGQTLELKAEASTGWQFVKWVINDADVVDAEHVIEISSAVNAKAYFVRLDYTLTADVDGEGTVDQEILVHPSSSYPYETVVRLTAVPEEGWKFVRWEGDLEGNENPAELTMDADKTVTAVFEPLPEYTLTIEKTGQGSVSPVEGDHAYYRGTVVDISAEADYGWVFIRWEGPVTNSGHASTTVFMDGNKTVKAVFEESIPVEQSSHTAGGVGFNMRLAPAATFPTGTSDSGEATVDTDFWIAETQVTYELWYTVRQWALQNGYTFANAGREGSHGSTGQAPSSKRNEPVTRVSWRDSIVWANALSEMLGFTPVYTYQGNVIKDSTNATACDNAVQENTNGFRLPTSNEWELAARYKGNDSSDGAISRGGLNWTPGSYASGATADYNNASATQEVAWYSANSGGSTKDVGLKRANGLGVYDMSGNVWEWCFDRSGSGRVRRGGSWRGLAISLQVGGVSSGYPVGVSSSDGLRLARTHF